MHQIKQEPEEFIVKEIPIYKLDEKGGYSYFWLTKKNYNTIDAIKRIAAKLKIPLKKIGFAGTKDKIAITKQIISIKGINKERIENLKDIKLEYIGNGNSPISLGDLKGNEFKITVRNLNNKNIQKKEYIPNYFGPQRFSKNNAGIGKALVKKEFKKAVELMDHQEVKEYLKTHPTDFIGAIRELPLKTRKIYVHAYQSELWNRTAKEFLKTAKKNIKVPIVGFATQNNKILQQEGITERDFIFPQIKELSAQGGQRDLFVKPKKLRIDFEKINTKYNAIVRFTLPKGSYATVVIDQLFLLKNSHNSS